MAFPYYSSQMIGSFPTRPPRMSEARVVRKSLVSFRIQSSLIFKMPPNCSNVRVEQTVAASWSNGSGSCSTDASDDSAPPDPIEIMDGADVGVVSRLNNLQKGAPADLKNEASKGGGSCFTAASGVYAPPDPIEIMNGADVAVVGGLNNLQPGAPAELKNEVSLFSSDGSLLVHAGERFGRVIETDAITTPVVNSSAHFFNNTEEVIAFMENRHKRFVYGRYGNPTTTVAESKISKLEGAELTVLMASGMCATSVMLMALVPANGHIVTTTDCYRNTMVFIQHVLRKMGIAATVIDPADMEGLEAALNHNNVSLFFAESPTNPFLRCVDIKLVSDLCHKNRTIVCIDGTFATPLNQKALRLGADLVLNSATKFIGGHNDVLAGYISGSKKLVTRILKWHYLSGGTINPNAAYLIIRGMKTLHLRVQQQNSTALRMAEILEAHPKVKRVHYPGLKSHPEHHIATKQMTGFGGVVSFEIDGDLTTAAKFVDALKIPYIAPSFGGCESIVNQPAIMSYWDLGPSKRLEHGILDNLVRFSFGVEDFEDLKTDVLQALDTI